MGPNILVIQFRLKDRMLFKRQPIERVLEDTCRVTFKNAVSGDIDLTAPERELSGFDAVILSGSSDLFFDGGYEEEHEGRVLTSQFVERAKPFAQYLIEKNVPTLGICFGHQLLGYVAGASVRHSHFEGKTGTHIVEITTDGASDPLMQGLPRQFAAHYGHKDVLFDLPSGATILACNPERCRYSALRYSDRIYGVQFHPEFSRDEIGLLVRKYPEYIPCDVNTDDLFGDSDEAERVLKNFVLLATQA